MSFWERYKIRIYKYGQCYAFLFGLDAVNYLPRSIYSINHRLSVLYSHLVAFLLIIVLPVYFANNIAYLFESTDTRWKLLFFSNCANTFVKYLTVMFTFIVNLIYYTEIRLIATKRQQIEDSQFHSSLPHEQIQRKFEALLLFKFGLINLMIAVQVLDILNMWYTGENLFRVYATIYTFILWNYTENMADYFYFINSSCLKFFRQLHEQLLVIVEHVEALGNTVRQPGRYMHQCCTLSDDLDALAISYVKIHKLYFGTVHLQQFQLLGLLLATMITNLNNYFTLFNLVSNTTTETTYTTSIVLSTLHALAYYLDSYIVSVISDDIKNELRDLGYTMRQLNHVSKIDARLAQSIEAFSLLLMNYKTGFRICGLFDLDRRLSFITLSAEVSYFITLVQFYLNFKYINKY